MYVHVVGWEYNVEVPGSAKLTPSEQREIIANTDNPADIPRHSILAAHEKIQNYNNTLQPPTSPPSPPYFSDDEEQALCNKEHMLDTTSLQEHTAEKITQPNPISQAPSIGPECPHKIPTSKVSDFGERFENTASKDKERQDIKVGDITIDQEIINRFLQLKDKGFQSFCIQTVCVGQVQVLQTVFTYQNKKEISEDKSVNSEPVTPLKTEPIKTSPTHSQRKPLQNGSRETRSNNPSCTPPPHATEPTSNPTLANKKCYIHPNASIKTPNLAANITNQKNHTANTNSPTTPQGWMQADPKQKLTTQKMATPDEEFVARFAALSATTSSAPIKLKKTAIITRDWKKCALVRIVTDRVVQDSQFSLTMIKAWGVKAQTTFTPVDRNIFLVQFEQEEELGRTINRGLWTFRGEMVVLKRAQGAGDLTRPTVNDEISPQVFFGREIWSFHGCCSSH